MSSSPSPNNQRLFGRSARALLNVGRGATAGKSYVAVADRLVVSGASFLTIVIVGRAAGVTELGMFALAWSVLLVTNVVVEALVVTPFTVFVGEHDKQTDRRAYGSVVLAQALGLAGAAMAIVLAAGHVLADTLSIERGASIMWALFVAIPMVVIREFARRFLFATLEAVKVFVLDLLVAALQLSTLIALWTMSELSATTALASLAFSSGIVSAVWLVIDHRKFGRFSAGFLREKLRAHVKFGRWVGAAQLSDLAATHGIVWVIAAFSGATATGIFAACNSLALVVNPLILGLGSVLLPRTARAGREGGHAEVSRVVWKVTGFLVAAIGVVCLGIAVFGSQIVVALYSLDFTTGLAGIIALLALSHFLAGAAFAVDNGLTAIARPDLNFAAAFAGLIVTLTSSLLLIVPLGLIGAALGVALGAFASTCFQFAAFARQVGMPQWNTRGR
jgi:O-antigen/teichoic acid export membrane protein